MDETHPLISAALKYRAAHSEFPPPKPLGLDLDVAIEPAEKIAVVVAIRKIELLREIYQGQPDNEIINSLIDELFHRYGIKV